MSETATTTTPEGSVPAGEVSVPEGYVPAGQVEAAREEARRRYQAENDRLKSELARLQAAPPAKSDSPEGELKGFDPDAFRSRLLTDVSGVISMTQTAAEVKAAYPHADPALFTPEKLAQFSNPDSLRFAAEDSHNRVAALLASEKERMRNELVAEFQEKFPEGSAGAVGSSSAALPGDPTPAQLQSMTLDQFNQVDQAVIERVLGSAV